MQTTITFIPKRFSLQLTLDFYLFRIHNKNRNKSFVLQKFFIWIRICHT